MLPWLVVPLSLLHSVFHGFFKSLSLDLPLSVHLFPLKSSPVFHYFHYCLLPSLVRTYTASVRNKVLPKSLIQKKISYWDFRKCLRYSSIPYLNHVFKFSAEIGNRPLSGSMSLSALCALLSSPVMADTEIPSCAPWAVLQMLHGRGRELTATSVKWVQWQIRCCKCSHWGLDFLHPVQKELDE